MRQAQQFKQMYANPAINVAMTFAEVFPIGLVITAVSAGILRKKAREPRKLDEQARREPATEPSVVSHTLFLKALARSLS